MSLPLLSQNCLAEIGDSAIVVALGAEQAAAIGVGISIVRIDFDRLAEIYDGAVAVAFET